MVILYTKHDLRSSVVPALNIKESSGAILARSSKINYLYVLIGIVIEQNILWFQIAMDHFLVLQVFHSLHHLEANLAQLIRLENRDLIFVNFHELVKVEMQVLKDDHHVLSEFE
jgi:hypothetical protein